MLIEQRACSWWRSSARVEVIELVVRRCWLVVLEADRRIEFFDVCAGGRDELIVLALTDGAPDKSGTRTYHLRGASGGDDYGAVKEVVERRFTRARASNPGWAPPDLLVVDGGRGQLAMVLEALREVGVVDQASCAIAKERELASGPSSGPIARTYAPSARSFCATSGWATILLRS